MISKSCPHCHLPFQSRARKTKFCSAACYAKSMETPPPSANCAHCGASFETRKPGARYCSRRCSMTVVSRDRLKAPVAERLWRRVDKREFGCWEWTGSVAGQYGHGRISYFREDGAKRGIYTHRLAWELIVGPIPEGLWVLHHCDNPRCVRADPDPTKSHLFLGTHQDNMDDMVTKGRHADLSGERGPRAVLTEQQVRAARDLRVSGATIPALARRFGVAKGTMASVIHRRTWRNVA